MTRESNLPGHAPHASRSALLVSTVPPGALGGDVGWRVEQYIRTLRELDFRVEFAYCETSPRTAERIASAIDLLPCRHTVTLPWLKHGPGWKRLWRDPTARDLDPFDLPLIWAKAFRSLLRVDRYDLLCLFDPRLVRLARLARRIETRWLDVVDLSLVIPSGSPTGFASGAFLGEQGAGRLAREARALSGMVCANEEHRDALAGQQSEVAVDVVPYATFHREARQRPERGRRGPRVLQIVRDNENDFHALRHFRTHRLPDICKVVPGSRLTVLADSPGRVEAGEDLEILPASTSLDEAIASSHLVVYPPCGGRRARVEIVEVLARGAAVIGTPSAFRGLSLDDRGAVCEVNDHDLSRSLLELLADPGRLEELRRSAAALAAERFSPAAAQVALRRRIATSAAVG